MPRRLLLLLPLLAATPLAAQPVPDTTSAVRYFPLEIGDVWEYERAGLIEGFERRTVVGDSTIADARYLRYRVDYFSLDGMPTDPPLETLLRIDPFTRGIVSASGDPNDVAALFLTTCPLDSDFFDELFDCPGSAVVLTSGGPETVFVGDDSLQTSLKFFDDNSREVVGAYAADLGYTGFVMRTGQLLLVYASVGGTTYGAPIPVASAPAPAPAGLRIEVRPNPARGPAVILTDVPNSGPVVLEAWDMLGRRVYREATVRPAGPASLEMDFGGWTPGPYVIRVTTAGSAASARVVVTD